MADWILVPCLVALRSEFNAIAPGRDRSSDGSIGDTAHAASSSDHNPDETGTVPIHDADHVNEVHAIDVDDDLTDGSVSYRVGNTTYYGMEAVVQHLLARCRSGAETRLRYIIFNRRIWSASSGWTQQTYTGSNPHTEHAHFSATYGSVQEADTHSWHLEDLVALTADDIEKISDTFDGRLAKFFERTQQANNGGWTSAVGRDAGDQGVPNPIRGGKTTAYLLWGDTASAVKTLAEQVGVSTEALAAAIDQVDEQVLASLPGRSVEEQVAVIVALLGPEQAAALGRALAGA